MLLDFLETTKAALTLPRGWSFGTGNNSVQADIGLAQVVGGGDVSVGLYLTFTSERDDDYILSVIRQVLPSSVYQINKDGRSFEVSLSGTIAASE